MLVSKGISTLYKRLITVNQDKERSKATNCWLVISPVILLRLFLGVYSFPQTMTTNISNIIFLQMRSNAMNMKIKLLESRFFRSINSSRCILFELYCFESEIIYLILSYVKWLCTGLPSSSWLWKFTLIKFKNVTWHVILDFRKPLAIMYCKQLVSVMHIVRSFCVVVFQM